MVMDHVVARGGSGIWTYRKWASGFAECWGNGAMQIIAVTSASNGGYISTDRYPAQQFPFPFATVPSIHITVKNGSCWITNTTTPTETKTPALQLNRFATNSGVTFSPHYYVIGRWK